MPHVRPWRVSDLPKLLQMAVITAWEISPPEEKVPHLLPHIARNAQANLLGVLQSPGGMAFVADEGGQPVGYLLVGVQPDERSAQPRGYLADIYVEPAHRRKGLTKALHKEGEGYLHRLGLEWVTNWTHAHNAVGQNTIESHGLRLHAMVLQKDLRRS